MKSNYNCREWLQFILIFFVSSICAVQAQWVAFNDHAAGTGTHVYATRWNVFGTTGGAPGSSGALRNIVRGTNLPVTLSILQSGAVAASSSSSAALGSPAYDIFNGYVDFQGSPNPSAEVAGVAVVTYRFTGLSPTNRYSFKGTAIRGGDATYANRWTLFELVGADSFRSAHTSNALTAGLTAAQVAIQTGINNTAATGDMADWEDIAPGADGLIDITSRQYTGPIPGGTANGSKAYALTGFRLEELVVSPVSITAQPRDISVIAGDTINLSVQAAGYPRFFQWFKDGAPLAGATNTTYNINAAALADAGSYTVVVSNSMNWVISANVQVSVSPFLSTTLMSLTNTVWAYEQSGNDLGTSWRAEAYDDADWSRGPSLLGWEDNAAIVPLMETTLNLSTLAGQRIITYYFRTHFAFTNDPAQSCLAFINRIDDGAVFYLNGTEIQRVRMPAGLVTATTMASNTPPTGDAIDSDIFYLAGESLTNLIKPDNVLAVEVHQQSSNSSDIVFGSMLKVQPVNWGRLAIFSHPQSSIGRPQGPLSLKVGVAGMAPITYRWYKNGVAIPGATNSSLVFTNLQMSDQAYYSVIASNAFGAVTSDAALVTPCEWQKTFGGSGDDQLQCVRATPDGGSIIGGYSGSGIEGTKTSTNYGVNDFWVVRLDASGNELWEKTFGGIGDDQLRSLDLTSDGGFILGGISRSPASGNKTSACFGDYDFWIVRVDADGNKLWDRSFGGSAEDVLHIVKQTYDGNFILAGRSLSGADGNKSSPSYGLNDFWLVLVDPNGNKIWDKNYGASGFDSIDSMTLTTDGGYVVGGTLESYLGGDRTSAYYGHRDWGVYRLDSNGNRIWDTAFGGTEDEGLFGILPTASGGYMLAGDSWSAQTGTKTGVNYGLRDFWVVCINGNGQKLWERTFGGLNEDAGNWLEAMPAGGYVLGGQSASGIGYSKSCPGYGSNDFWVVRFDDAGNKLWDVSFGGASNDILRCMAVARDGSLLLGGNSDSGMDGNKTQPAYGGIDWWLIKLSNPEPAQTPRILTQPQSRTVGTNQTIVLSVQAVGNPLYYQWFKDNMPIPGATSSVLAIPSAGNTDSGYYYVLVSNALATVTSTSISVFAGPPPSLQVTWPEGDVGPRMKYSSSGFKSTVLGSTDLKNWLIVTNVPATHSPITVSDPVSGTSPWRWYKVQIEP